MGRYLIVVESPTKAKTIRRFVGKDYVIKPCFGHLKDLPEDSLGVDIENNFQPTYQIIKGKGKVLKELKKLAEKMNTIYLASDPDREGETISWHLQEELKSVNSSFKRLEIHEITYPAIKKALSSPRQINMNLVSAQQARRVLDRLVGYLVSPLLWERVKGGISAGRVQSVALRIICEREKEIEEFTPEEYWEIECILKTEKGEFSAWLKGKEGEDLKISSRQKAEEIRDFLKDKLFTVEEIKVEEEKKFPPPPFITSSLQQTAFSRLRFSPSHTMRIAQQLYEGLPVGKEGRVGLITYMRTDSPRVSSVALRSVRKWIKERWGEEYIPEKPYRYRGKKTAQEAHEAIRPTSVLRTPEEIKPYLEEGQGKLYSLIWERFVASQMSPSVWEKTSVTLRCEDYYFSSTAQKLIFEGFLKIYPHKEKETTLPPLKEGEKLRCVQVKLHQKFTQPPPRFTEGSLVRELEEKGIGRPSTYATILSILKKRDYVRVEKGRLRPTPLGKVVNKILIDNFPKVFEIGFTAWMEEGLDRIEEGKEDYLSLVKSFYREFSRYLSEAQKNLKDIKEEVKEMYSLPCPKCGAKMVIKRGRFGEFLACPNYPECRTTLPLLKKTGIPCPECEKGELVIRRGKGRTFYGCSNYPRCKFTTSRLPVRDGKKN